MNAPTGRKISVSVSENATCASDLPNSLAIAVRHITTRKKSNASSVQPRNPAVTAERWSWRAQTYGILRAMLAKTLMMLALVQGPTNDPVDAALAWVRRLDAGGFDSAAAQIDAAVPAGLMSAERLRVIWGAVTQQYGTLGRLD